MDELLREFLNETVESLDRVDAQLVRFEREPNTFSASFTPLKERAAFLDCRGSRRSRTPPKR